MAFTNNSNTNIMNKVLIIDDEAQIRKLLARMMELEGYEVCQATDCRSGLKQIEVSSPEVVLCDVRLPDGNGVDLVGSCGTGHAVIRSITFDVEEALVEAEVVLVSAMAKRHEAITD